MPHELKDKVAVVTGAAQGLGLGMVERLAGDGAKVIIADVQQERAESEAEGFRARGLNVEASYLDVGDSNAVNRFFDAMIDRQGRLDVLRIGMRPLRYKQQSPHDRRTEPKLPDEILQEHAEPPDARMSEFEHRLRVQE